MPTSNCSARPQTNFIDNTASSIDAYPWGPYEGVNRPPPVYPRTLGTPPTTPPRDGVGGVEVAALSSTFMLRTLQVTSPMPTTPTGADRLPHSVV